MVILYHAPTGRAMKGLAQNDGALSYSGVNGSLRLL